MIFFFIFFFSIITSNSIFGTLFLFSIIVKYFDFYRTISAMWSEVLKKAGSTAGKVIIYGAAATTGIDSGINVYQKLKNSNNNQNNNGGGGDSSGSNDSDKKTPEDSNPNPNPTQNIPKNPNPNPDTTKNLPNNPTPQNPPSSTSNTAPSGSSTSKTATSGSNPMKSSLFFLILSYLDIKTSADSSDLINLLSSILNLEIIVLAGFINLLFYFIFNILVLKYDIESKFNSPYLKKLIRFYVQTSWYFILFEIILTLLSILTIIYIYYEFLKIFIFNN